MIRVRFPLLALVPALAAVLGLSLAAPPALAQPPSSKKKERILSDRQKDDLAKAGLTAGKKDAEIPIPPAEWVTVDPDKLLVIDTNKGRVVAELSSQLAPAHVERIQTLARQHFYDGLTFFRVIPEFMDQTGDPENSGKGGSKLPDLKGEFTFRRGAATPFVQVAEPEGVSVGFMGPNPVYSQASDLMAMTKDGAVSAWGAYCAGVLGMAREDEPDTANSQFFLMRDAYPTLERKYTVFGMVLMGLDVVRAIKTGEPVADPQDRMTRVRLASDLPAGEKMVVRRQDPAGAAFKAQVARIREKQGADFSVCDVSPAAKQG